MSYDVVEKLHFRFINSVFRLSNFHGSSDAAFRRTPYFRQISDRRDLHKFNCGSDAVIRGTYCRSNCFNM